MIIYTDGSPRAIAYVQRDGKSDWTYLPPGHTSNEAEYLAIQYALNEFFLQWNKELDARRGDLDVEKLRATGEEEWYDPSTPSQRSRRPLPPPIEIRSDSEVTVKQLNRQWHIREDRLRRLAQQVWNQIQNLDVKFTWVPRYENLAGKMLK